MSIKFAKEICQEILNRGTINIPKYAATGEDFERWLYIEEQDKETQKYNFEEKIVTQRFEENEYFDAFGEAA